MSKILNNLIVLEIANNHMGDIKHGIELINTLPLLPLNLNDIKNTNVGGSSIININQIIKCNDCSPDERRIKLYITDPKRPYLNYSIILRYINGQTSPEKVTVTLYAEEGGLIPNEDSPTSLRLPNGEYLMEKQ